MTSPAKLAPSNLPALPWLRFSLWGVSVFVAMGGFYLLSLGLVARYYQLHPPPFKPGMIYAQGNHQSRRFLQVGSFPPLGWRGVSARIPAHWIS